MSVPSVTLGLTSTTTRIRRSCIRGDLLDPLACSMTIARSLSDTFAGIAPSGVLAFIAAQLIGMLTAVAVGRWLWNR